MLTKTPLTMLTPGNNAQVNDEVVYNGQSLETQAPGVGNNTDLHITDASYDPESGVLTLTRNDTAVLQVSGFMTSGNIGTGPRGPTGPSGAVGQNGRHGKDGRPGIPGCTGPKGDSGPAGPQGATGPQGPRGYAGPTGPQGPAGASGASGADGERPVYTAGTINSTEKTSSGRLMMWGRFTDSAPGITKQLLFPEALANPSKPVALHLQWVNPSSNVANKVRVQSINAGYAELSVNTSLLDQIPDGSGGTQAVPASGWDFYWTLLGE